MVLSDFMWMGPYLWVLVGHFIRSSHSWKNLLWSCWPIKSSDCHAILFALDIGTATGGSSLRLTRPDSPILVLLSSQTRTVGCVEIAAASLPGKQGNNTKAKTVRYSINMLYIRWKDKKTISSYCSSRLLGRVWNTLLEGDLSITVLYGAFVFAFSRFKPYPPNINMELATKWPVLGQNPLRFWESMGGYVDKSKALIFLYEIP